MATNDPNGAFEEILNVLREKKKSLDGAFRLGAFLPNTDLAEALQQI